MEILLQNKIKFSSQQITKDRDLEKDQAMIVLR